MFLLDNTFKDIKSIIASVVIKYEKQAKELDTIEITREADRYVSAMTQQDSFNTYASFDIDAIYDAGVTNLETAQQYADNKYKIPLEKRDAIVLKQRERIIKNYVEQNNYYRMLNGLPDTTDFNYVYLDEESCIKYKINPNTPAHELTKEELIVLESKGVMDTLRAKYPTKKYLAYLGPNTIPVVQARTAKNFAILRMTKNISEGLYTEFSNLYEQSREYFMSVIYIKEYSKRYDMYDNFIAMMIMVMTIQRVITNMFKYGIERDFYDLGSIEMMFDSYNIPFMLDVPLEYQRVLVRNLNNLLRYKATDKVLYDICSLLGFERIKIFKYYLMKEHKLDNDEKPLFVYKEDVDEQGNPIIVEDKEQMYNFYFQTVEINERNTALALANSSGKLDYTQTTVEDPYWIEDDELKAQLLDSDFNYIETKYLNMNIMYKMTEMLFEVMYVFRMLFDKKSEIDFIAVQVPKLFYEKNIKLFDLIILMCALLSKKNGFKGNVLHTPSKILSIYGFNFKADFDAIRADIKDNPALFDQNILTYLEQLHVHVPADVNTLYHNVKALNDFLVEKLAACKNIQQYEAYKKLYMTLMVTQETEELFMKSDGTIAETFLEYLGDSDKDLYNFVETCETGKISEYIDHIITKINELMSDVKYLYIINDSNNALLNAVITLTRFFKSYTTDLVSMNIYYLMDSRYFNMIKLITDVKNIDKQLIALENGLSLNYMDMMKTLSASMTKKEFLPLLNWHILYAHLLPEDVLNFRYKEDYSVNIDEQLQIMLKEYPHILKDFIFKNYFDLKDKFFFYGQIYQNEFQQLVETEQYTANMHYNQKYLISLVTSFLHKLLEDYDIQTLKEGVTQYHVDIRNIYNIPLDEVQTYFKEIGLKTDISLFYSDSLTFIKEFYKQDGIYLTKRHEWSSNMSLEGSFINYLDTLLVSKDAHVQSKLDNLKNLLYLAKSIFSYSKLNNFHDKYVSKDVILYPEEHKDITHRINYMQKDFEMFTILMDQFADMVGVIQVALKEKDNIVLKEKIQLVYEE